MGNILHWEMPEFKVTRKRHCYVLHGAGAGGWGGGGGERKLFLFSFKKYLIDLSILIFTILQLYCKYHLEHQQVLMFGIGVECLITYQKR